MSAERLIAICRLVLALFSLTAIWLDPTEPARFATEAYGLLIPYALLAATLVILTTYFPFGAVGAALCHAIDVALTFLLMLFTEAPTSPFFVFFTFNLIAATLRWNWRGTLWTGVVLVALFLALMVAVRAVPSLIEGEYEAGRTLVRLAYFAVAAAMLAYVGAYLERSRDRIARLAQWPTRHEGMPDRHALEAILRHASTVVRAPRALVVWQQQDDDLHRIAAYADGAFTAQLEPVERFGTLAAAELTGATFATVNPDTGPLMTTAGGRLPTGDIVNPGLRSAFTIESVASAPVEGSICQGRVFLLDRASWTEDHLLLAQAVGSRLAIELDHYTLRERLEREAAVRARLGLARDVHDSVLQALTAAQLQLALFTKKPDVAAGDEIETVREILATEQRRLREFVEENRERAVSTGSDRLPATNLYALVREAGLQWNCETGFRSFPPDATVSTAMVREISFFLSEAIANAVRHGSATSVEVAVQSSDGDVRASVVDDGKGMAGGRRPRSLDERAREIGGEISVQSSSAGTSVELRLPQAIS